MPDAAGSSLRSDGTPSADPALDVGARGQTLLHERLALYGLLLTAFNVTFFIGSQLTWGGEPTVGPERAWSLTFSPPSLALQLVYLILAIVPRLRSFPPS